MVSTIAVMIFVNSLMVFFSSGSLGRIVRCVCLFVNAVLLYRVLETADMIVGNLNRGW